MIKDFKTYIEESRLGRNLMTSFGGGNRIEDDFNSNIRDIKEVDLGCKNILFADRIFKLSGKDIISRVQFDEISPLPNGWRLPTLNELQNLFKKGILKCSIENESEEVDKHLNAKTTVYQLIITGTNGNEVRLDFSMVTANDAFYAQYKDGNDPLCYDILTSDMFNEYNSRLLEFQSETNNIDKVNIKKSKCAKDNIFPHILLVKDNKKRIEESRIGRNLRTSFSDSVREDILPGSNIKSIKPIDFNCDVLYGDRIFCKDEEYHTSFEKIYNLGELPYGWRLPSVDELKQLFSKKNIKYSIEEYKDKRGNIDYVLILDNKIRIDNSSYFHHDRDENEDKIDYYILTGDMDNRNDYCCRLVSVGVWYNSGNILGNVEVTTTSTPLNNIFPVILLVKDK